MENISQKLAKMKNVVKRLNGMNFLIMVPLVKSLMVKLADATLIMEQVVFVVTKHVQHLLVDITLVKHNRVDMQHVLMVLLVVIKNVEHQRVEQKVM